MDNKYISQERNHKKLERVKSLNKDMHSSDRIKENIVDNDYRAKNAMKWFKEPPYYFSTKNKSDNK